MVRVLGKQKRENFKLIHCISALQVVAIQVIEKILTDAMYKRFMTLQKGCILFLCVVDATTERIHSTWMRTF